MRLVEQIFVEDHNSNFRTRYTKYRAGRLKHQYWLWNRKQDQKKLDIYDASILRNCQPGKTAFFASAGYYLKDIWPDIDSIEMHPVVKEFYPNVFLVETREHLDHIDTITLRSSIIEVIIGSQLTDWSATSRTTAEF